MVLKQYDRQLNFEGSIYSGKWGSVWSGKVGSAWSGKWGSVSAEFPVITESGVYSVQILKE